MSERHRKPLSSEAETEEFTSRQTADLAAMLATDGRQRAADGTVVMTQQEVRATYFNGPTVAEQTQRLVARLEDDRRNNQHAQQPEAQPAADERRPRNGRRFLAAAALGAVVAVGLTWAVGHHGGPARTPQAVASNEASPLPSASIGVVELPAASASASASASPSAIKTSASPSALPKVIETSSAPALPPASSKPKTPAPKPTTASPSPTHSKPKAKCWTVPASPDPEIECTPSVTPTDMGGAAGNPEGNLVINANSTNIHVKTYDVETVDGVNYVEVYDPAQANGTGWILQDYLAG